MICLACGHDSCKDIRRTTLPLVNNLLDKQEDVFFHSLTIQNCQLCGHSQLKERIDPDKLFKDYLYKTGASKKHQRFFKDFAEALTRKIPRGSKVLDIGCNDGTLLRELKRQGFDVLGIEPAKILAQELEKSGIRVINDFFPVEINEKFDCLTAFNVFAHNRDPYNFLKNMADILKPEGRIYILTVPISIDNTYHEHISYFTPQSMSALIDRCDLELKTLTETDMHGLSHLFEIRHKRPERSFNLKNLTGNVIGYGASANGIVLMNILNIAPEYVIDDNPLKQGKFIPGNNVPIVSNQALINDIRPLTIIVFAYHLFDEITNKIKSLRPNSNDIFINPVDN